MKYYIIYDTTKEKNDKQWLSNEFINQNCECVSIYTDKVLSKMNKNFFQILKSKLICFKLAFKSMKMSKSGDTIVCWLKWQGLVTNLINKIKGNKRIVLSLNWLTPPDKHAKLYFLEKLAIKNENFFVIVNSTESISKYEKYFNMQLDNKMIFIPDIYRTDVEFKNRKTVSKEKKTVFIGGMNNRDWDFVIEIANHLPNIDFICIALEKDWNKKVKGCIPENVKYYFGTSSEFYYEMLSESDLVLMPLCENKVSGLINITRAIQEGILVLVSNYSFSRQYFDNKVVDEFCLDKNVDIWVDRIKKLLNIDEMEYNKKILINQNFLKENFSPYMAIEKLRKIVE